MKKFLKKLDKLEIIMGLLFLIISIISIINFGLVGALIIPILIILIIIYYNSDNIVKQLNKKKGKKKSNIKNKTKKTLKPNDNEENIKDIIIDSEEEDIIEGTLNEKKEVGNMKKISSKSKKGKRKSHSSKSKSNSNLKQRILKIFIIVFATCVFAVSGFMLYIIISSGTFDPEKLANQDQTVVYDVDGEVIATLGREKRETVTYDQLPQVLVDAIIATEDSRFFEHNGVDMARFLKASVGQLLGNSDAGGASTLTMQVVKNNLTSTEKSIIRKFKDVYISAFILERNYSKEEILEFYVNDSLLGGNVYGVEQASQYYFGKSVSELSLPEASLIAGLFQSPNGYNPYNNPEGATERRNTVLKLMVRHGYITQEEADLANSVSVESLLTGSGEEMNYQGYIDTVVDEIIEKTDNDPYLIPMKIYTAMDKDIQDGINKVLSGEDHEWADEYVQAGIAVVDVNNGAISAIGAGRNREGERTWNFATQEIRHPGSTAKPLFDYGPGFEYNNFSTYTLFNDEPWQYTDGPEVGNWDGTYQGLITLRQALSVSRNIPALKAFQQVSKKNIISFVESLGIEPEKDGNSIHEAHAIGAFEKGATPLQMAAAYAAFASGGYYTEPYTVTKIEYRDTGEVEEFKADRERVMSDSTAYLMNNVLQYAVEYGFNGGARVYGSTVAAKTGTSTFDDATLEALGLPSSAVKDLWTVAYTPEYSIALWYGYQDASSEHYLTGASAPKDAVMSSIMKYIPKTTKQFEMPDSVVASQVEFGTWPAQLPSEYTPSDLIRTEYFKKGTEPTEVSQRFAKLDPVTNLKATTSGNTVRLTWSGETPEILTESYLREYFSQSVFGNGTESFVNQRLSYNNNTLGGYGYGIYVKSSSGNLTQVGFTTDNSYTYNATIGGNITIVVKAEYRSFKANASDGVEVDVNVSGGGSVSDDSLSLDIGASNLTPSVGNYTEPGVTVTYNGEDVTDEATISYTVIIDGNSHSVTSPSEVERLINEQPAGTYYIRYRATYQGESAEATRTVTVHN